MQRSYQIYFSFSEKDEWLANAYAQALFDRGHRIIMGQAPVAKQSAQPADPQEEADGTLVFLTRDAMRSKWVGEEVRKALAYAQRPEDPRFLVGLKLGEGEVPAEWSGMPWIPIYEKPEPEIIEQIEGAIQRFPETEFNNPAQNIENKIPESEVPGESPVSPETDPTEGPGMKTPAEEPALETDKKGRPSLVSDVDTDAPYADIPDALDFRSDVNALASVIAYKKVEPPLAIGLFGNWGTGKSFFMNKLQARIQQLADSDAKEYCDHVISINFNSWHYSDSNLWASLITKIFEDLEKYGTKKDEKDKLKKLLENLNSAKELLDEKKQEEKKLTEEIGKLTQKKDDWEKEIDEAVVDLGKVRATDILAAVWKDPVVKKDVEVLQKKYEFLELKEYGQMESDLEELGHGMSRFRETLKLVYSFRKGRLWLALLAALAFFALFTAAMYWAGNVKAWFDQVKYIVGIAAALTSQAALFMRPLFQKLGRAHERLVGLKQTCDAAAERERQTLTLQMDGLNKKIETAKTMQEEVSGKIKMLEIEKIAVETELNDILSGRKIIRFIESRVTDQRYINSLGIISWVRKDFEELDFLLKQQYDANKMKELHREAVTDVFQFDRIVLYIDDLDRCEVATVVRVLEAIHLLLAFPLFVVVVGVDPRWMHNALNIKYEKFLQWNNHTEMEESDAPEPEEAEQDGILEHPATSYDYLEKIFQIPFVLKPVHESGKKQLIWDQFHKKGAEETGMESVPAAGVMANVLTTDGGAGSVPPPPVPMENLAEGNVSNLGNLGPMPNAAGQAAEKEEETEIQALEEAEDLNNVKRLEVSDDEVKFMQAISFLIGDSPRTIKRYINIYRIIRSHSRFIVREGREQEYYMAAMVLLGMLTGLPSRSRSLFDRIKSSNDNENLMVFLFDFQEGSDTKSPILQQLADRITEGKGYFQALGAMPMKVFKENQGLVSRFTFRYAF